MFIIAGLFIFLICVIVLFAFPTFSPIPYFPTNYHDIKLIIKALNIKNDQTIIDLGAGDGVVIFKTAEFAKNQKLNTKFIAIDINPILILIMHIRRFFHPNRQNIKIVWGDLFKINYGKVTKQQGNKVTIYLYVSPWLIEQIIKNWKLKIKIFSVVSYFYPIKSLKKHEKSLQGKNKIYVYELA